MGSKGNSSLVVLVADDEPAVRKMMARVLGQAGCKVIEAENPEETEDRIKEDPDVVFLDILFERGEPKGIEVLKRIRKNGFDKTICMLTGHNSTEYLYNALLAGADDYILKGDPKHAAIPSIFDVVKRAKDKRPFAPFNPIADGAFLKSRDLNEQQLELLSIYSKEGYPTLLDLAKKLGTNKSTLSKSFLRIEKRLGVENRVQLASLLTIVSGYGARYREEDYYQ